MIACVRIPGLAPIDPQIESVQESLSSLTPYVELERRLELRADARKHPRRYVLPPHQMDETQAATIYLDLGKLTQTAGVDAAMHIHRLLLDPVGAVASMGMASGRFPARVMAGAMAPNHVGIVPYRGEARFLEDHLSSLLPVDGETLRQLDLLGLRKLGQIAALPELAMAERFGTPGRIMHRLASGRDTSPVAEYRPRRFEEKSQAFETPLETRQQVEVVIQSLLSPLVEKVHSQGLAARRIQLTLTLENDRQIERSVALRQPSTEIDHLTRSALDLLPDALPEGVIEVQVKLGDLAEPAAHQLSLFGRDPVSTHRLRVALKTLVERYGSDTFFWAALVHPEARLAEQRFELHEVTPADDLSVDDRAAD